MSNPYTEITFSGYNSNPPTDDGAKTGANQIKWATIKSKLADPVKTTLSAMNTNVKNAFATLFGVVGPVTSGSDLTMVAATHRGATIVFTGSSNNTLTLEDATDAGAGFVAFVRNGSTGTLTIAAASATPTQYVNGVASIVLNPRMGGLLVCDGSKFYYVGPVAGDMFEKDVTQLFFTTAAPTGWTKDTSFDDAAITLTSGTAGDVAGNAFSAVMADDIMIAAENLPDMDLTVTDPSHTHALDANKDKGNVQSGGGEDVGSFHGATMSPAFTGISVAIDDTSRGGTQQAMDFSVRHSKAIRATKAV